MSIKFLKKINNKGFTLIELIVVIAIIAIIATAALTALNPFAQFQKASDSRIKSDLSQIQKALEVYYQDKGQYPLGDLASSYRITDATLGSISWGSNWGNYMNVVPKDPTASHNYIYYSDGQSYYLYANLLRGVKDAQVCHTDGSACSSLSVNGISGTSCGATCNFGVSSPDKSP